MLPALAVGRISAPSLPETLSHIHLKKLLRYVPGACGSGVCCWLVAQSVWLLVCHSSLSVPSLWVCHCPQQFWGKQALPTGLGRAWQARAHSWAAALALSTPGLVLTTARPAPDMSPSCPLSSALSRAALARPGRVSHRHRP